MIKRFILAKEAGVCYGKLNTAFKYNTMASFSDEDKAKLKAAFKGCSDEFYKLFGE